MFTRLHIYTFTCVGEYILHVNFIENSVLCAQIIGKVVLVEHVLFEAVRRFIEIFLADAADEAAALHVGAHLFNLIAKLSERIDDQTCEHTRTDVYE